MTIKQDHKIMELLGVTELRHLIAHTSHGELTLMIRKGENQYRLVLDAVPVEPDVNTELMAILFPPKEIVPQVNTHALLVTGKTLKEIEGVVSNAEANVKATTPAKKKGGRPRKAK